MATIRLDLKALVQSGDLAPAEAERLAGLALPETGGRLWISCLLIFGALSVAAGAIALVPTPMTGLILAVAALGGAAAIRFAGAHEAWRVLSAGLAIMGAVGVSGWIAAETLEIENAIWPPVAITAVLSLCAAAFRSSFLTALSVLSAGSILGTGTVYWHASYGLFVREPTLSILVFGGLAAGFYALRSHVAEAWQSLVSVAARTSVFLVNFGFWVGSLWGDHVGEHWAAGERWRASAEWREVAVHVPEIVFTLGWAAALFGAIILARRGGFLAISSVVFLAIHGYTQYFELLGASPATLLIAGLVAVGGAVAATQWLNGRRVQAGTG